MLVANDPRVLGLCRHASNSSHSSALVRADRRINFAVLVNFTVPVTTIAPDMSRM